MQKSVSILSRLSSRIYTGLAERPHWFVQDYYVLGSVEEALLHLPQHFGPDLYGQSLTWTEHFHTGHPPTGHSLPARS